MLASIKGFHIEPTNLCTLKCPGCARTQFLDKFGTKRWKNHQLNFEHLKSFLDIDIANLEFLLCGNYGDSIYYNKLHELVAWIKSNNGVIKLATNGSYKTQAWWDELTSMLDERDSITFGIDGTPDNFALYRINADWESIRLGIDSAVKSKAKTVWQYIPFAYNTKSIEPARKLAVDLGIDTFKLLKSDRFDSTTAYLIPPKEQIGDRFESNITFYSGKQDSEIVPQCVEDKKSHHISATGFMLLAALPQTIGSFIRVSFIKINKNTT